MKAIENRVFFTGRALQNDALPVVSARKLT